MTTAAAVNPVDPDYSREIFDVVLETIDVEAVKKVWLLSIALWCTRGTRDRMGEMLAAQPKG